MTIAPAPPRRGRAALARPAALALALLAACRPPTATSPAPDALEIASGGAAWTVTDAPPAASPAIRLTASDGTGLRLVAVQARGWLEAPLALTELRLVFENPEPRVLEGTFEVQLPPRAAVSRFAMRIGDRWQEGEVVERQAARRTFEDFLHRRQDPALLEHDAGDHFRARVFPIPARAQEELILTYSQELAGDHDRYSLPLAGLPPIPAVDVRVFGPHPTRAGERIELLGPADAARALHPTGGPDGLALRSGDLALARITIAGDLAPAAPPPAVTVLFDTSASQAGRFPEKIAQLRALVARLSAVHGAALPLRVWCFDQAALEIHRGTAGGFTEAHAAAIRQRGALGATALPTALAAIRPGIRPGEHVLVVGDGVDTAGDARIPEAVAALRRAGVARIDAVVIGGNRDLAALQRLVAPEHDRRAGVLVDGDRPARDIVDKLRRDNLANVRVRVPGSRWSWPERLDGVQPGDTALVYAELPADAPLRVTLDGAAASPSLVTRQIPRPLLERAWAGAKLTHLLAEHDALPASAEQARRDLRTAIITLSRRHRVLSPYTALLVLEREADYQSYGIPRDALVDILSVDEHGPTLLHRDGLTLRLADGPRAAVDDLDPRARPVEDTNDRDRDQLPDSDDRCPEQPETYNGFQDEDGCPDEIPQQVARFTSSLRGIYFDRHRATIAKKQAPVLDHVVTILNEFTGISLEISGHCARGEPPALGQKRAEAVRDYLVARGIDADRLPVRNARLDEPIDRNDTANGRARNRRSEFRILLDRKTRAKPSDVAPHSGPFAEVTARLATDPQAAVADAQAWWKRAPGDVLAALALGDALAAAGRPIDAARAYGSLIDLFPARADLRRHAGERLAALGAPGLPLAIDTYQKAVVDRPDHLSGHRLLAYALARAGRHEDAFAAILAGLRAPAGRWHEGVDAVLREDAQLLGAFVIARAPDRRAHVEAQLARWHLAPADQPSTRFALTWETDANDVDLHVIDGAGDRADADRRGLPGGALIADVRNGYGPEQFVILGAPTRYPYTFEAHYFSQGPMGYGMGTLQIVQHDGAGGLRFDERPFLVMNADARVPLGRLTGPLP